MKIVATPCFLFPDKQISYRDMYLSFLRGLGLNLLLLGTTKPLTRRGTYTAVARSKDARMAKL